MQNGIDTSSLQDIKQIKFGAVFKPPKRTKQYTMSHISALNHIELLLDTHQSEVFGSESGSFSVSFNSDIDGFDASTSELELLPGQRNNIFITATVFETTLAVRNDYSDKERSCRFQHETQSNGLFASYSKKRCEYECALNKAISQVNCAPWNFIHSLEKNISLCTRDHVWKFYESLSTAKKSLDCTYIFLFNAPRSI